MLNDLKQLDPLELAKKTIEVHERLRDQKAWRDAYPLRPDHPPMLILLQGGYESQIYMEIAARMLRGEQWADARRLAIHWRPAMVKLYEFYKDKYTILIWGTARDKAVKKELKNFLRALARWNAQRNGDKPHYYVISGGSQTGAMGCVIDEVKKANTRFATPDVLPGNVILGFTEGEQQTEMASAYGLNSPPLFTFMLRLYFLGLLGRPVLRIAVNGGIGSTLEVAADWQEWQMDGRVITLGTRHEPVPTPTMVFVGTILDDGSWVWDGLVERHMEQMTKAGTAHPSELPPIETIALKPRNKKDSAMPKLKPERKLWTPGEAARRCISLADDAWKRMPRTAAETEAMLS